MSGEDEIVGRCLAQIDALGDEFGVATQAIVSNALSDFEASVGRQQELLRSLATSLPAARGVLADAEPGRASAKDSIVRMQLASRALSRAGARYSAVLTHTRRSMRMLQSLYGARPETRETSPHDRQTWSLQG